VVDISDLVLLENAILNGVWDDGIVLGGSPGQASPSSQDALITFEVYEQFMAVRLRNPMAVRGLQLNLRFTASVATPYETDRFQRVDFMEAASKVVGLRHTILMFNMENRPVETDDQYILFIKGDWSAYDIPATDIVVGDNFNMRVNVVSRWVQGQFLPMKYKLEQNYPNPFNPTTSIQFEVPEFVKVKLQVFDMLGRRIRTLINTEMDPGVHVVVWDGTDETGQRVSSGVYLYRMRAGDFIRSKKMLLIK
ncbi:MAG TPA: FlgD immunoglobulin-like domain containing protein, partial [Bacteroidota bacterium]